MPKFLCTTGRQSLAIGICDRCRMKRPFDTLVPDGNSPGLKVCADRGCWDSLDPWRLPARETENFSVVQARPDAPLAPGDDD